MGKVRGLGIGFDGNVNLFSQGDVIKGQVVVQVDNDKDQGLRNVKGIWVRFQGKGKTKWTTRSNKKTHTHSLKESYFDTDVVVFGTARFQPDVKDLHIPIGRNSFPFRFQLPTEPLPSPFEAKYGYVRYRAKVTVSLIRTFSNKTHKSEKLFSVTGPMLDLNAHPQTQEPVDYTEEMLGCCGCSNTAEAIVNFGLPKQGYVPGESIYVKGRVDNREREERTVFTVNMIQRITFHSNSHAKEKKIVLLNAEIAAMCPRGQMTNISLGPLRVPPVPASGLPGCNIIDVQYYVEVEGFGYHQKFVVVIGTVPHRIVSRASTAVATAPPAEILSAPPYEAPPPSYEQAVGVIDRLVQERDPEEYFGGDQFVPRYPYFDLTVDMPSDGR